MTVTEALNAIQRVGTVENYAGNLMLRFPETGASEIQSAIDTLRAGKAEALALLPDPDTAELARASAVLNRAGVRIMQFDGTIIIGAWSDLDGPGIRAALCTLGHAGLPIRYLDGAGVPVHYKVRSVKGEPVPLSVLAEMERQPGEPWKVRDRMLTKRNGFRSRAKPGTGPDQSGNGSGW